ncbi:MAG: HAD-IIIC family phosphatase [Planctomycetes bacterium]|nr:HAD-IIIC family phosphatase [Planctomycetota bacterium]
MEQRALFKRLTQLANGGSGAEALEILRDALRRGQIDAEGRDKAGRLIARIFVDQAPTTSRQIDADVLLLGQVTTSWLVNSLTSAAWERGLAIDVREGQYDNVFQELMARAPNSTRPGVIVFLPWGRRLAAETPTESSQQRLEEELAFWKQAWEIAANKLGARVLQVGFDWMMPGSLGHHLGGGKEGAVGLIRRANEMFREALPPGSYFLDLEQVSGTMGRDTFYDRRRYHWTKQPFSEAGSCLLARHLSAGIKALLHGPKKVLVVDLDNTLWGGVVGETGPLGISLGETPDGEAFLAFQKHLKTLTQRGVLLAISSKNNPEDARAPFESHPEMALRLADFAHIEANWEPKEMSLRRIAETLNLGLDSFVFFDDNPAEREHIRQALPEVEVVEVPQDPADYVHALQAGLWFETVALSDADRERALQYQQESGRRQLQQSMGSMEEYLRSLEMRAAATEIDESTLLRVVQLIGKTNQFNLTTRRHGLEEVRRMLSLPDAICVTLSMSDRFGDHGLIAVLLAIPDVESSERTLHIDTWLMSCRVIGRTAEHFLFNALLDRAHQLGYCRIKGEFIPTRKNALVAELYDQLGFSRVGDQPAEATVYELPVSPERRVQTWIEAVE